MVGTRVVCIPMAAMRAGGRVYRKHCRLGPSLGCCVAAGGSQVLHAPLASGVSQCEAAAAHGHMVEPHVGCAAMGHGMGPSACDTAVPGCKPLLNLALGVESCLVRMLFIRTCLLPCTQLK